MEQLTLFALSFVAGFIICLLIMWILFYIKDEK